METSSITCLLEMGMEDPAFIHHCEMSVLDEFTTQQVAAALGEDFQHSFTESFLPYTPFSSTSTTTFSCSSMERPTKQLKIDSWNSCSIQDISTPNGSSPKILSFANHDQHFYENSVGAVKPEEKAVTQNHASKTGHGNRKAGTETTKSPSSVHDHVMAERMRRQKISKTFIALSAIVPGLKKMDKATVLEDAIKYLKQLQERVKTLEEETTKKSTESVVFVKKLKLSPGDDTSSLDDSSDEQLSEIEARVSDTNVLIRIHCQKQKGILMKILSEIEELHLTVINSAVMPFGNSALQITVMAQMDGEFCMTVKDLVKNLRSGFRQFM